MAAHSSSESTPDTLDAIFAQLRLDVEAASTREQRSYHIDKAEIAVKSLELREFARVRREGMEAGRGLQNLSGGMVTIKRGGDN